VGASEGEQGILKLYIFRIKFLAKKVVFLVSRGKNEISRLLGHLQNFFGYPWKNPLLPLPGKIIPTPR